MLKLELKPDFTDARGTITDLLNDVPISSVNVVTSLKGAIRGNKYHRRADKYIYLINGTMEWLYREGDNEEVSRAIFVTGDFFLVPSGEHHAMRFLEDTVIIQFTTESRAGTGYEDDTVRLEHPLIISD
jgi:quercetin dioxygenase-like cupin family protein